MKYLQILTRSTRSFLSGCKNPSRQTFTNLLSEDINRNFQESLPNIIGDVVRRKKYFNTGIEDKLTAQSRKYNMKNGNNIGGVALLHAYSKMMNTESEGAKSTDQAFLLAWAVEMMHSHNLLMNQQNINGAINSAIEADLLRSFMNVMLEEKCDGKLYKDVLALYNKAFMYNALAGDIEMAIYGGSAKFLEFNYQQYDLISEYRTGFQFFTLPLSLAMKLVGKNDQKLSDKVGMLCSKMGKMFQMKKDYNDCFGGEVLVGTSGSDIQNGRATWLAVEARRRAAGAALASLAAIYGDAAPAHVERVKYTYKKLRLPQLYREQLAAMYDEVKREAIDLEKEGIPSDVFLGILDEIVRDETLPDPKKIDLQNN